MTTTEMLAGMDGPYTLPDRWRWARLGDLCVIQSGGTPAKANRNYWQGDIPWISPKDMRSSQIDDAQDHISEVAVHDSAAKIVERGTILIVVRSGILVHSVPVAYANRTVSFNQDIKAISPDSDMLDSWYLLFTLKQKQDYILAQGIKRGPTVHSLISGFLEDLLIPLPPLTEQRRIVTILAAWERASNLTTQLITVNQERKHGLMQQLLVGGRRFPGFQYQWTPTTFGHIFSTKSARNTGSRIKTPITVGKYAIRPQSEHFNRVVASDNLENYNVIEYGDFVYDPMSAYYGAFGRYELDELGIVSPVYRVLRVNPGHDSDFLKHVIKSHHIMYQLSANSSQGNRHGKRRTIQAEAFDSVSFAIPALDEQRAIAQVLNTCDRELALLERKLALLQQQKQGLMQQLLTGKVRVPA